MKNIKNVGLSLVLLLGINSGFALAEELPDISNNTEAIANSLSETLRNFKSENPQFDYGIASVADLYHKEINIDDFYSPKEYHPLLKKYPFLRKALFASEMLAEGLGGLLHGKLIQQRKLADYVDTETYVTNFEETSSSSSGVTLQSSFEKHHSNNVKVSASKSLASDE